jgi:hypothetical protein
MAFTKALYYPRIEVPNEGWLKTAILYWDEVKTIVPPRCESLIPEGHPAHFSTRAFFLHFMFIREWIVWNDWPSKS